MENILSILVFIPLLAALILAIFLRGDDAAARQNAKWLALTATGASFFVALSLFFGFNAADSGFQFEETRQALFGLTYRLGLDGLSLVFVMLVTAIMPLAVAASWRLRSQVKGYVIALLAFETALLGAILSLDLVFFILFFEAAVIPVLLMAGLWSGAQDGGVQALKAWLYTVPGTVLLIAAAFAMVAETGTTDMTALLRHNFSTEGGRLPAGGQGAIWLMVAVGVAVKAALWPLHTWLPGLVARAPLAVGLLIAALLTKLGLYGFFRILVGMLPVAAEAYAPYLAVLAVLGILAGALSALASKDLSRVFAYVVVAQTGAVVLAGSADGVQGLDAAVLGALAHGLVIAGLFALALMLEDRAGSRDVGAFGALRGRLPVLAGFFMIFALGLVGLPGTVGFVSLALSLYAVAPQSGAAALGLCLGIVLMGAVALLIHRKVMLGGMIKESLKLVPDLDGRERAMLGLLLLAMVVLGLWPGLLLERMEPTLAAVADQLAALR